MKRHSVFVLIASSMLTGCATTYFEVTDLSTGSVYHTTSAMAERYEYSGALRFIDGPSNAEITLSNSRVKPISKEQYEAMMQGETDPVD